MAEFQEVMRQWGRYCEGYTANHNDDCAGCPFEIDGSCNSYAKDNAQYAEHIEKHVMAWAAAHPEPVYPTWGQYFRRYYGLEYCKGHEMLLENIPADIAQKLGVEPRETKKRLKDQVCGNDYERE